LILFIKNVTFKIRQEIELTMTNDVPPSSQSPGFETYIESWDSRYQSVINGMPMQNGMTVDISFDNWGAKLDPATEKQIVGIYNSLEAKAKEEGVSINIKLSFGGATYPMPGLANSKAASALAQQVSGVLTYFQSQYGINFSGVDLDIESSNSSEANVSSFIQDLRTDVGPDKIISLTIPGQGWSGFYHNLATDPNVMNAVSNYQFMEYDIWVGADSLENQIKADILTYTGKAGTQAPPPNDNQTCWGLPPSKVHLGLMPGPDDQKQNLTPQAAEDLAQFAKDQGLGGVMIWSEDRDAGTDKSPPTGYPPFTFSNDILDVLNQNDYQ
jgi:hypothetical protein